MGLHFDLPSKSRLIVKCYVYHEYCSYVIFEQIGIIVFHLCVLTLVNYNYRRLGQIFDHFEAVQNKYLIKLI